METTRFRITNTNENQQGTRCLGASIEEAPAIEGRDDFYEQRKYELWSYGLRATGYGLRAMKYEHRPDVFRDVTRSQPKPLYSYILKVNNVESKYLLGFQPLFVSECSPSRMKLLVSAAKFVRSVCHKIDVNIVGQFI